MKNILDHIVPAKVFRLAKAGIIAKLEFDAHQPLNIIGHQVMIGKANVG